MNSIPSIAFTPFTWTAPAASPPASEEPRDMTVLARHPSGAPKQIVLPADRPLHPDAIQKSRSARYAIGGTIAGGLAGSYVSMALMGAYPLAGVAVMVGTAVLGGIMGYWAAQPPPMPGA